MPRQHVLEPPARWAWCWPSQSTGFTLSRWVSQRLGWVPVPREWRQSPTQICAEWNWSAERNVLVPSHARKPQLISQAARTRRLISPDFQIVAKPCPEAEQNPCQLGIFFLWSQVFYCTMEIDIAWHGPWLHFLLRFRSRWFVWSTFWPFFWSPVSAAGLRATRSSQKRSQNTWKSEEPHVEI